MVGLYSVYEATRGLVAGGTDTALRHAQVLSLERSLHLFVKRDVQRAAGHVPQLMGTLGFAYLRAAAGRSRSQPVHSARKCLL